MTVVIYRRTEHGNMRLGPFRTRKGLSVRAITAEFMKRHPHADAASLLMCRRLYQFGKWVDSPDLVPLEPEAK